MKFREGNVFTGVCQSVQRGEGVSPDVTITHDALDLSVQPLHLLAAASLWTWDMETTQSWPPFQTCDPSVISDGHHRTLLKLVHWTSLYSPSPNCY